MLRRIPIPRRPRIPIFAYLAVMGPGLITAMANNDAGGITTYSIAGAEFGYHTLWILLILTVLLAVTQEMGARMGAVTGKGLADLIREEFGLRAVVFALATLLVANTAVTASEFAGIASGFQLFGLSKYIIVPIVAFGVWALISSGSFRRVERVFLVFVFFFLSYIVSGFISHPPWGEVLHNLVVPSISKKPGFLLLAIALTGTTVAPWGQFFIQSYVRDKGTSPADYRFTRLDVVSGSIFTDIISFFIIVATAVTLFATHIHIETAADAARALGPLAGRYAKSLFGVGFIAASVLASAILPLSTAYVVCEAFGWESGVGKRWSSAPRFNSIFTLLIGVGAGIALVPHIHLVKLMVLANTLNGILLPVILIYTVRLAADKGLMGEHANGRLYSAFTWVAAFIVIAMTILLLVLQFV
ncbi:MAG: Nramp family divalent metal transporter [Actinomycetota bacterium]|nr:Nramp family divalent metal transporter [Actinomycetota bacterium]